MAMATALKQVSRLGRRVTFQRQSYSRCWRLSSAAIHTSLPTMVGCASLWSWFVCLIKLFLICSLVREWPLFMAVTDYNSTWYVCGIVSQTPIVLAVSVRIGNRIMVLMSFNLNFHPYLLLVRWCRSQPLWMLTCLVNLIIGKVLPCHQ